MVSAKVPEMVGMASNMLDCTLFLCSLSPGIMVSLETFTIEMVEEQPFIIWFTNWA